MNSQTRCELFDAHVGTGHDHVDQMEEESGSHGTLTDTLSASSSGLAPGNYTAYFYTTDAVHRPAATAATTTFTVTGSSGGSGSGGGPSITLSANPTSLTTGSASTLTAVTSGVSPNAMDEIDIVDVSGDNTLGGQNSETTLSDTSATATATDDTAQTVEYEAEIINFNSGAILATSAPVDVTWTSAATAPVVAPTITLSADPTKLASGDATTLTYDTQNFASGDSVVIMGTGGPQNYYATQLTADGEATDTESPANGQTTTVRYVAEVLNAQGQAVATSKAVSVEWTSLTPTLTLSANPTTNPSGNMATIAYTVANMGNGDYVAIAGTGGQDMWEETHDTQSAADWYEIESPYNGNDTDVHYTATLYDASGSPLATATASVDWTSVAPTVTLTANPAVNVPGQPSELMYQVQGTMAPGDFVSVAPIAGNGSDEWRASKQTAYEETDEETENPQAGQTIQVEYQATLYAPNGSIVSAATVTVEWVNAWDGALTLTAQPRQLGVYQSTTLTVDASQAVPAGDTIYLFNQTTGQMVGYGTSATYTTTYASAAAATDTFVAELSDGYETLGTPSNTASVQWTSASIQASPTLLGVHQTSTIVGQASNLPKGDWLLLENTTTGQVLGSTQDATLSVSQTESQAQTDSYESLVAATDSVSEALTHSTPVSVDWYAVTLTAQPTYLPIGQNTTLTASTQNLPNGYVLDIVRKSDGKILATGTLGETTLTTTTEEPTPSTENYVADIIRPADTGYGLWAAVVEQAPYVYGGPTTEPPMIPDGAVVYNGSTWTNEGDPNGDADVTALAYDAADGDTWAGTSSAGVAYWNGNAWVNTGDPGGDGDIVGLTYVPSTQQMWALTRTGVAYWDGSNWIPTRLPALQDLSTPAMTDLTAGPNGTLLLVQQSSSSAQLDEWNGYTWLPTYSTALTLNFDGGTFVTSALGNVVYDPLGGDVYLDEFQHKIYYNSHYHDHVGQAFGNIYALPFNQLFNSQATWTMAYPGYIDASTNLLGVGSGGHVYLGGGLGPMYYYGGYVDQAYPNGSSLAVTNKEQIEPWIGGLAWDDYIWPQPTSFAENDGNNYIGWSPADVGTGGDNVIEDMANPIGDTANDISTTNALTFNPNVGLDQPTPTILQTSSPVSVTWYQYDLSLTTSPTMLATGAKTTLTATAPAGMPSGAVIQIRDETTDQVVGTSAPNATSYTTTWSESSVQTDTFVAAIVSASGQDVSESDTVPVTWTEAPLTLSDAEVYHAPGWQTNLDNYNKFMESYDPSMVRSESDFWAGEMLKFRVKPSLTDIAEAYVEIPGLNFPPVLPPNMPVDFEFPFEIPLTYDAATGYLEGHTPGAWATWLQYLENDTYTVEFWVKSADHQVATAHASFTIWHHWVGATLASYYQIHETY
ncbi:hypothetical protein [Alicyclobacillus sp. SP_1]|uniref:hypothetical protein n=1 Tax=Alicyclobacillus sp. SP_1 TaxID=2942475 RepID=UPI002157F4EA|nr:hypothetical protein [Alicyclobacillus sp. SP_1]